MKRFLKNITNIGWIGTIVLSVVSVICWLPDFLLKNPVEIGITFALCIVNAFLLMVLAYRTGVTRTRSGIPLFCYMLLVGTVDSLHSQWEGQLAVLCVLMVMFLLIRAYRSQNAVEEAFLCGILIAGCSLLLPDVIFLLPALWIGFSLQRAFNGRIIASSLTGVAVVALYSAAAWWMGWLCPCRWGNFFEREFPESIQLYQSILLAAWAVLFIVEGILSFSRANSGEQSYLSLMALPALLSVILIFFPSADFDTMQGVAALTIAAFATHFFSNRNSVWSGIVFLLWIVINLGMYVFSVWQSGSAALALSEVLLP